MDDYTLDRYPHEPPYRFLVRDGITVHEQSRFTHRANDNKTVCGLFLICYRTGVFGVYGPHRAGEKPAEGAEDDIAITTTKSVTCCICLAGED